MAIHTMEDEDRTSQFAAVLTSASSQAGSPPPARRRRRIPRWATAGAVVTVVLVLGVAAAVKSDFLTPAVADGKALTEKVHRSDLLVSIAEDGNVESSHNVDIKCGVKGGSTILWLIRDGTEVQKGDELVRFDSSSIEDSINQQKITYEKARATMIESEKSFEAAKIAVNEYIEGTYVQGLQDLEAKATVAKENLESARNAYQFTEKMLRKGYVTPLQRDAQAFAVKRSELDLGVAEMAKMVLEKFTKEKTLVGLQSTRDSAEARMASDEAAFKLEEDRLERLETQLKECRVLAPDNGMVIYANEQQQMGRGGSSQQSIVEEGAIMRERQTIIKLPDLSRMQVKCTVHESKVDMLQRGMRAQIHIQDHEFTGTVTSVANQAEPTNWMTGNIREYAAIISIDSNPHGLRPGMTAAVEILVANLKNALSAPVEAVVEQGGKFYCWASTPSGPQRRPVVLGMSNNTRIEIKDGLADGDIVLKNPRAIVAEARADVKEAEAVDVKKKFGGDQPAALPKISNVPGAPAGSAAGEKGREGGGRPRGAFPDFKSLDKDSDGKISLEEAPDRMKARFDDMDTNKDGSIDAKEWAEIRKQMQKMQEQMRAGGQGAPGGAGGP
jgi:HlyD family secretion protein